MNRRVLWAMIILLWVFLIAFAVTKVFFDDWFVAAVENEKVLLIGNFIDDHRIARIVADALVGALIMQFYLCACLQRWRLSWVQYLVVIGYSVAMVTLPSIIPFIVHTDLIFSLLIPILFGAKLSQVLCMFAFHNLGQILTLFVRGEAIYLSSTNYAVQFVLLFDMYIWLVIYYLHANLYKEEGTLWENLLHTFSVIRRKMSSRKSS